MRYGTQHPVGTDVACCIGRVDHVTEIGVSVSGATQLGEQTKEFARRLRKGVEAAPSASSATHVAGTVNDKRKYVPDTLTVAIVESHPGRLVTPSELESHHLLAPPSLRRASHEPRPRTPGYRTHLAGLERCVAGAPPSKEGPGPDRSMADFFWCMMAAQRGWSIEETAEKLMEVSAKAQERAPARLDALITAQNGAAAAERGRQRGRQRGRG